jgi:hypothetical protein
MKLVLESWFWNSETIVRSRGIITGKLGGIYFGGVMGGGWRGYEPANGFGEAARS